MTSASQTDSPVLNAVAEDGVMRLTLNRPEKRNALSRDLLARLEDLLGRIAEDTTVRVVVLGASGPIFCAGHDLSELVGRSESAYREMFATCTRVMQQLRRLPQPVIARVHGLATAAGCQLAATCDLVVASENASFAAPGVKIGLFCTTPMVPLVRAMAPKVAMEMLLTGQPISAQRAWQVGLVNQVVPASRLDVCVREYVDAILSSSPEIIRLGKAAFYEHLSLDETTAYKSVTEIMTKNVMHPDAQEGISAFLEKRRPNWTV